MASLNEIKTRISSVNSTQKITSAMMMVSSAKLTRAQGAITSFLPYQEKLDMILTNVLSADSSFDSPFTEAREVKKIAIVVCTSNSSLCGGYNSNVIKRFRDTYQEKSKLGADNILTFAVGKKGAIAIKKAGVKLAGEYESIADNPTFEETQELAKKLINLYISKEIDEVAIIYSHFITAGTQRLLSSTYLPFDLSGNKEDENTTTTSGTDYIFEPSKEEILENLIPTVLYSRLFAAFLDASASEHAARMIAMQTATDNADELKGDLTIQYNKQRQQAVTNELLDIIGGANAIN